MKISIILKILGLSIALAIISFFILNYMAQSRLNRIVNPTFDITKVVAIERASISEHSEVYNDGSFIEYECVYKDSCLDLVNLGRVDSLFHHVEDIVEVINTPIPLPNSFFPNLIAPSPYKVRAAPIAVSYNVYTLPYSSLNKVKLYIGGKIKNKISESATTVKYELSANRVDIALNNGSEVEVSYSLGIDNNRIDAELVFNLHNGNLYVVVLAKALDVNNLLKKYLP
ncbi:MULTISPECIES: hypothetical protein [Bacteroides]|jgi:hypothetical protein|uniref:Uncharacterized protein n=1 Tax=Bacteroides fragilis TaxID=817 RepID=A0A413JTA8_BACFG|nr:MULTISPECIES: hypothetical protein [Bacteroides]EKA81617.1 hypothetical protein HMPREF1205_03575 [Bacteroides fragilis HMW 616]MBU3039537.1 hypothetical protein [Bacteroides sp. HF-4919]MBY2893359.1 hypothetical protein [Bacteroides fragilis]MCE8599130.1 hypothetical protein [Bacteroides fragilis]MCE8631267.1 hypothetical protein [Bacteroides fragilis]